DASPPRSRTPVREASAAPSPATNYSAAHAHIRCNRDRSADARRRGRAPPRPIRHRSKPISRRASLRTASLRTASLRPASAKLRQACFEFLAGTEEARFYRGDRGFGTPRNILVGLIVDLAQQDDFPKRRFELSDGDFKRLAQFGAGRRAVGPRLVAGELGDPTALRRILNIFPCGRETGHTRVAGNLVQPSTERRVAAKCFDGPDGAQKHLLARVFGFLAIAHHSQAKSVNPVAIGAKRLSPGRLVAARQLFKKCPLGTVPSVHLDRRPSQMFPRKGSTTSPCARKTSFASAVANAARSSSRCRCFWYSRQN